MINLIRADEDACALCTSDKPKKGYHTQGERMGESFLCKKHIDKLMEIEEPSDPSRLLLDKIENGNRVLMGG